MLFRYQPPPPPNKWAGPNKLNHLNPVCFISSLVEIGPVYQWLWRKMFLKFRQNIFAISLLSPLRNMWGPLCEETWIPPSLKDAFCQVGWNWPSDFGENDFKILSMCFCFFFIISPWNCTGPFIWPFFPFQPRRRCVKFIWNWRKGSGKDFKILLMYFCSFFVISALKWALPIIWTHCNSFHPVWLLPSLVKIGSVVFEKILSLWSPLGKGRDTSNFNYLHSKILCARFGLSCLSGSEENDFLISSIYFHLSPLGTGLGPTFKQI